jgi:hypothetical protein
MVLGSIPPRLSEAAFMPQRAIMVMAFILFYTRK